MKDTIQYIDPTKLKRGHTYVTKRFDVVTVKAIDKARKMVRLFNHTTQSNDLMFFRNVFIVGEKIQKEDTGAAKVLPMKAKFVW